VKLPWLSSRYGRGGLYAAGPAAPAGASTVLENVAVVGNTSTLEAITNEAEGFIAYNDETFQLWVSSVGTTASVTLYNEQDSGT
jgi:hypothetical protein